MFRKKLAQAPRELDLEFEGRVRRIQFNPPGGFKMTVIVNGAEQVWCVPNDPGNRHCQFIRQWISDGGFPEDADPPQVPKVFGVRTETWQRFAHVSLTIAAVVGAGAAVAALVL